MTTICELNNVPPNPPRTWSRFVPLVNPYLKYTESELSMRRKYEILQYGNKQYTGTKKQAVVEILKGSNKCYRPSWGSQREDLYSNPNVMNLPRVGNTLIYNVNTYKKTICTSSYRSDIPGKEVIICGQKNVPITLLYTRRTYN